MRENGSTRGFGFKYSDKHYFAMKQAIPMQTEARKRHWEQVYNTKTHFEVSWHQPEPTLSCLLIEGTELPKTATLLDIGSGTSTLVVRHLHGNM